VEIGFFCSIGPRDEEIPEETGLELKLVGTGGLRGGMEEDEVDPGFCWV
jgi:hypothetical protein